MSNAGWKLPAIGWWLASFIFLCSRLTSETVTQSSVVEPLHSSTIASSAAWGPPLSKLEFAQAWAYWPNWIVAALVAALIAVIARRTAARHSSWLAAWILLALSLSARLDQLIAVILVVLACSRVAPADLPRSRTATLITALVVSLAAMLTTIEFGIVLVVVFLGLLSAASPHSTSVFNSVVRKALAGILVATPFVVASFIQPSFFHAMIRPLTAACYSVDHQILPSLVHSFGRGSDWPAAFCLLLVAGAAIRYAWKQADVERALLVIFLGIIGIVSRAYLWLALAGTATFYIGRLRHEVRVSPVTATRNRIVAQLASVFIAVVHLYWTTNVPEDEFAAATAERRMVDTGSWRIKGSILLTNLDHAGDWNSMQAPANTSLLMDNRWDVNRTELLEYVGVCQDLMDGRRHSYRRSDGAWGGFAERLGEWEPSLIVLDSQQLQAIRRLSVDPNWNVLSIDARRTIFGNPTSPQVRAQAQRAGELFYFLEWPNSRQGVAADGVLELGTPSDATKVAAVFNAIRLPYAALRALPDDKAIQTELVRVWCYVELAHRALRQTGRLSLIDQARAVSGLRTLEENRWLTTSQRRDVDTRLRSLTEQVSDSVLVPGDGISAAEQEIRILLADGRLQEVRESLQALETEAIREFYAAIEACCSSLSSAALKRMELATASSELPQQLQEEGYFYLGGLALELRMPGKAGEFLLQSRDTNDTSPRKSLRDLYLRQLLLISN
ncbi:hypothetical protein [Fuerstiella marisgermanici]|uniref:Transmembrane protein n=1 Tax=Fuerstiella marisgermanici TaxID=1891926 RepID=A0A1P8WI70_9PLAN|nr:hypothetical protein [Fuerstiella marisgermanici]APZ93755.1 hypothetical protein Fuma_03373 [Fuerstiella marisgermanici]